MPRTSHEPPTPEPETLILGKGTERGVYIFIRGCNGCAARPGNGPAGMTMYIVWYLHGTFPATAEMIAKSRRPVPMPSVVLARARVERDEGRLGIEELCVCLRTGP